LVLKYNLPWLETTAHTLAATIGHLAVHEDIQEDIFEQIMSVVGYDREPVRYTFFTYFALLSAAMWVATQTIEDSGALYKVLAAFYEALRMFRESGPVTPLLFATD
jgi:cytochrome P450